MTINTRLILVSAQPIPNLTPILDDTLRPNKVVMLVSPDMQERSKALENIYKPRGILLVPKLQFPVTRSCEQIITNTP
jgi:hypothetical protein